MYTPAFPAVAQELGVSDAEIQLTLTAFMAGIATAQLIYGPISDRFGRRPVLLASLVLTAVGTIAVALSPDVGFMAVARLVQASGAAGSIVLARAIVRDINDFEGSVRGMAVLNIGSSLAPAIALLIGGAIAAWFGWRSLFWISTALTLILLAATFFILRETRAESSRPKKGSTSTISDLLVFLKSPLFMSYSLSQAFLNSTIFAFMAGAPFYLVAAFDLSTDGIGLLTSLMPLGFIVGNVLSNRLNRHVAMTWQLVIGGLVAAGAALTLSVLHGTGILTVYWIAVLAPAYTLGVGFHIPNATAGAIEINPARAGTGSSLYGFISFGFAAPASFLVGVVDDGGGEGMFSLMLLLGMAGLIATLFAIAFHPRRRAVASEAESI
jgi:DHA1 family bicyclomycin/chloramphenicol resistance-like MFS transporter